MQENQFLTVKEVAGILRSTPESLYTYLCDSGSKKGKKRKRFPSEIYIKLGRKTLFIKQKLMDWIYAGAQFEGAE